MPSDAPASRAGISSTIKTFQVPCYFESTEKVDMIGLCFWKEALLDELFGNLHGVGCGSLAEVVGHAPEVEAGLH